jgi:hypothetical protein
MWWRFHAEWLVEADTIDDAESEVRRVAKEGVMQFTARHRGRTPKNLHPAESVCVLPALVPKTGGEG